MTTAAIPALRTLRAGALDLARKLSDEEWRRASACAGWSVRDVYAHMGGVLHGVVDPAFMRAGDDPNDMEAGMEVGVAERRSWPIAEVVGEYDEFSAAAIGAFEGMQSGDIATAEIPMGNLGTHPLHLLANAFVFDAYCHLRNDLLQPFGPLDHAPPAPHGDVLGPIMDWMIAGLPQMCAEALAFLERPVLLQLDGAGGGAHLIGPGDASPVATVSTTPDAFVRWGTQRSSWRDEGVTITGDEITAARFCDACNVI